MLIDAATLAQVTTDVADTMLGISVSALPGQSAPGRRMVASVCIRGESNMSVEVETVRELARPIAGHMFAMETGELEEMDLRDALGEVANMIGGNVKGILCGEYTLSLPRVEERPAPFVAAPQDISIAMSSNGFPFNVRIVAV